MTSADIHIMSKRGQLVTCATRGVVEYVVEFVGLAIHCHIMFPLVESSEHQRKKQIRNQTEVECVRVRERAGKNDVASGKGPGLRQHRVWSDLFFG